MIKREDVKTVNQAFQYIFESVYRPGDVFYGRDIHSHLIALLPKRKNSYIETTLRDARRYARDKYKVISNRGLYEVL